jgi:hypothetical protein
MKEATEKATPRSNAIKPQLKKNVDNAKEISQPAPRKIIVRHFSPPGVGRHVGGLSFAPIVLRRSVELAE